MKKSKAKEALSKLPPLKGVGKPKNAPMDDDEVEDMKATMDKLPAMKKEMKKKMKGKMPTKDEVWY